MIVKNIRLFSKVMQIFAFVLHSKLLDVLDAHVL